MIKLDRVSFWYRKQEKLFENLSLELFPGHVYGLLGKNGAGKSSLLRNIVGLLFPKEGKIEVGGYEPGKRQPGFLQDIIFIPEEIYLPSVTVQKYLRTMAPFYPRFDQELFLRYIEEFEIPQENRLTELSQGQKKKVQIAFALAANTRVLIMDEPTNGLDIPSKSQFRKMVSASVDEDRLILISTHQVRDLDNLIDSIIILEDREIKLNHSLDEVAERLYFGTSMNVGKETTVLYAEPSGLKVVAENTIQEESRVDLEQLFHAVIENPAQIKELFKTSK